MTAGLLSNGITKLAKGSSELFPAEVAREFQAGMTSSLTI
jgi:hypothetical protein